MEALGRYVSHPSSQNIDVKETNKNNQKKGRCKGENVIFYVERGEHIQLQKSGEA